MIRENLLTSTDNWKNRLVKVGEIGRKVQMMRNSRSHTLPTCSLKRGNKKLQNQAKRVQSVVLTFRQIVLRLPWIPSAKQPDAGVAYKRTYAHWTWQKTMCTLPYLKTLAPVAGPRKLRDKTSRTLQSPSWCQKLIDAIFLPRDHRLQ
jgi:hypothetical protein